MNPAFSITIFDSTISFSWPLNFDIVLSFLVVMWNFKTGKLVVLLIATSQDWVPSSAIIPQEHNTIPEFAKCWVLSSSEGLFICYLLLWNISIKGQNLNNSWCLWFVNFFCSSLTSHYYDHASRFVRLLSKKHSPDYLESDDFIPLLQVKKKLIKKYTVIMKTLLILFHS